MKRFLVMAAAMLVFPASAAPSLGPYRVDGTPVPSSCLARLANGDSSRLEPIDLSHCGNPAMKPRTREDGMIGYDDPQGGYFYYRYLGRLGDLDVLYMEMSGGGTGRFTSLVGITSQGRTVRAMKEYGGGDRCNGGLSHAALANGRLTYDQAVTPYDLIALADPDTKLKAYEDLEASAASCIGESHMTGNGQWTGVSLTEKERADREGWTDQYRYQACFNALYRETVAAGHTELDRNGVKAFTAGFTKRCIRPKP